jgi:hypothetical protein
MLRKGHGARPYTCAELPLRSGRIADHNVPLNALCSWILRCPQPPHGSCRIFLAGARGVELDNGELIVGIALDGAVGSAVALVCWRDFRERGF